MINSTALIGLILWCSASFRIPEAATLRRRAGRQHGGGSETFWASCIMLFVLSGKDGQVTGCTEPPPESQMDLPTLSPSPLLHLPSSESRWILSRCLQPSSALWPFLRAALEQIKCPPPFFFLQHAILASLSLLLLSFSPRFLLQLLYLFFVSLF